MLSTQSRSEPPIPNQTLPTPLGPSDTQTLRLPCLSSSGTQVPKPHKTSNLKYLSSTDPTNLLMSGLCQAHSVAQWDTRTPNPPFSCIHTRTPSPEQACLKLTPNLQGYRDYFRTLDSLAKCPHTDTRAWNKPCSFQGPQAKNQSAQD